MRYIFLTIAGVINHLILNTILNLSNERGDFGGGKSKAEEGIARAGSEMYGRGAMTEDESKQYEGSFDIGRILNEIARYRQGLGGKPSGYLTGEEQYQQGGPLAQGLYGQTLSDLQDPYASYESTLQPQLQAAEDYINRGFQQRGLLRSGLPIESMGRAGVELAIQEANNRMNWRQQMLGNAMGLSQYGNELGQQNYGNLANQYNAQQGYGLTAMNRQAGQAQAAAGYQAYPYQARLGDIYGRYAAMYALPGQIIGALGNAARLGAGGGGGAGAGGGGSPGWLDTSRWR